jgi:hypothetical protein
MAQEKSDEAAIKETVLNYLEGFSTADTERMERALHPNLSKCVVAKARNGDEEYLNFMTAELLVLATKYNKNSLKLKPMKILYQDKHYAQVHIANDQFYDLVGLVKLNGEWKIIHVLWAMNEK